MEAKRKADEEPTDASKKARGELIAVEDKGGKNQQLIVVRLARTLTGLFGAGGTAWGNC